ncbi:TPA: DNA adenine methylase [Citrobacter freundii]|uniref:DNA adenine methylase n=1 Tax=Citrobacter TaxID=544 RepID=UPI001B823810|nr:DNA adenine methylase [Citrobacter sp. Cf236]HBB9908903.1 DNA adenine methylase [Citrobacter freundii]MDM3056754.1 DNA adenine methylase [Citrobacter sp. Cf236]HBC2002768.1 DNA adenine methylase [Citrobacter freundii]HBM8408058.1 DNA adenine methylase [Citrobacter freundii]HBM9445761.1 DNA adenine methylase [Citrobacter freundii]
MSFRYLGNKTRLADWIVGEIMRVLPAGSTIADPMCGTASVSLALARANYSVIAADALTFPVIHARARLLVKQAPAFKVFGGYYKMLEWMRLVEPVEGYFFREFGQNGKPENGRAPRLYFSATNAAHIDGVRDGIRKLAASGDISEIEHSLMLHHLILATNKVANISGTYGYFLRKLSRSALQAIGFDPIAFEQTPGHHMVLHGPIEEHASRLQVDAVYLDPPYTKRQYAGNYHILETLAREDEPVAVGDGGLRPWKDQASDFCYRRNAVKAFRETLKQLNVPHVFISYSPDGQVHEDELFSLLSEFGMVKLYEQPYARYRSNGRVKDGAVLERLYHIETFNYEK